MIAILICSVLFASASGELSKQPSDVNFVITKPEANILAHSPVVSPALSAPVNLIKYGPLAGHPIQVRVQIELLSFELANEVINSGVLFAGPSCWSPIVRTSPM